MTPHSWLFGLSLFAGGVSLVPSAVPATLPAAVPAAVPAALPAAVPATLPATLSAALSAAVPGEELPKGPPWFQTYRGARRDALRHGRPVFVYFTKTV
jgi:hypothetical protein